MSLFVVNGFVSIVDVFPPDLPRGLATTASHRGNNRPSSPNSLVHDQLLESVRTLPHRLAPSLELFLIFHSSSSAISVGSFFKTPDIPDFRASARGP
jgi:hypothetical protein